MSPPLPTCHHVNQLHTHSKRFSSSDVYLHEMPGGQYTNLKFQVRFACCAALCCAALLRCADCWCWLPSYLNTMIPPRPRYLNANHPTNRSTPTPTPSSKGRLPRPGRLMAEGPDRLCRRQQGPRGHRQGHPQQQGRGWSGAVHGAERSGREEPGGKSDGAVAAGERGGVYAGAGCVRRVCAVCVLCACFVLCLLCVLFASSSPEPLHSITPWPTTIVTKHEHSTNPGLHRAAGVWVPGASAVKVRWWRHPWLCWGRPWLWGGSIAGCWIFLPHPLSISHTHTPNQTKPNQTKPNPTNPNRTKPNQTTPRQGAQGQAHHRGPSGCQPGPHEPGLTGGALGTGGWGWGWFLGLEFWVAAETASCLFTSPYIAVPNHHQPPHPYPTPSTPTLPPPGEAQGEVRQQGDLKARRAERRAVPQGACVWRGGGRLRCLRFGRWLDCRPPSQPQHPTPSTPSQPQTQHPAPPIQPPTPTSTPPTPTPNPPRCLMSTWHQSCATATWLRSCPPGPSWCRWLMMRMLRLS